MFIEEQSRANIFVETSDVYYDVGSPLPAAVTIYSSEGLSGQFYDPTSNPASPIGGFAQKIDDGSGTIYEDWSEQTLTHLCDVVPITWTLTINILDLNTYTSTTRTDVVTLSNTPVTYTLRCTAVNQLLTVDAVATTIPV